MNTETNHERTPADQLLDGVENCQFTTIRAALDQSPAVPFGIWEYVCDNQNHHILQELLEYDTPSSDRLPDLYRSSFTAELTQCYELLVDHCGVGSKSMNSILSEAKGLNQASKILHKAKENYTPDGSTATFEKLIRFTNWPGAKTVCLELAQEELDKIETVKLSKIGVEILIDCINDNKADIKLLTQCIEKGLNIEEKNMYNRIKTILNNNGINNVPALTAQKL